MATNRRLWLKQIGLGLAGLGLTNAELVASPLVPDCFERYSDIDHPIILRLNENPYGPSPLARKALLDNMGTCNRYNWDITSQLISAISRKNDVRDENILLGAGSTEILDLVAKYVATENATYVIADPSFHYWTSSLDNLGMKKISVPLTRDKKVDLQAMLHAIRQDTKLVYICNPNNPTGTICDRDALVGFVHEVPKNVLILIDEAYLDFTNQQSLSNLITQYPNIIIVKTFSKVYGLAGARVGYALAENTTINRLSRLQSAPGISVGVLSRLAALASLKDEKFISDCRSLIENAKEYTIRELKKLNIEPIASHTNFIYFSLTNYKKDYFQQLDQNNIQGTGIYEEQGKWTRITVGTMQEMKQFIKAIQ